MNLRRAGMCVGPTVLLFAVSLAAECLAAEFCVESVVHVRGREAFTVATRGTDGRAMSLLLDRLDPAQDGAQGSTITLPGMKQHESLGHDVQLVISRGVDLTLNCDIEWRFRAASRGSAGGPRFTTKSVREVFMSVEGKPLRLVLEWDVDGEPRTWLDFIVKDALRYITVYNAADLLVPFDAGENGAPADFESLIKLIRTEVQPDAWDTAGGESSITAFPMNLSLIITATQGMHAEVCTLLDKLRQERAPAEPK